MLSFSIELMSHEFDRGSVFFETEIVGETEFMSK